MIVREPGALPAALERLLLVDRVASLPPLPPLADRSSDAADQLAASPSAASPFAALAAEPLKTTALLASLPLGKSITARVVDVPADHHVVADVGELRIALAWPATSRLAPQPGQDVVLRVLAHRPVLLFQSIEGDRPGASGDGDEHVHWSSDAMRLQAMGATATTSPSNGAVRFDIPILEIDVGPLSSGDPEDATARDPSTSVRATVDRTTPSAIVARSPAWQTVPALVERVHDIALDDVIVGRSAALVDGNDAPPIPHPQDLPTPLPFSPLVLQGPAWDGQPMELVVRRERDDELFDNPVLDHWCGEVTIDLPHLGRVAGHLSFSMQGLRVRIEGDDEHSVTTMSAASSELAAALAHVDLRVAGLTVAGRSADTTRTDRGAGVDPGSGGRHG